MTTTRLAIDGLWRCLCPSFDAAALALPLTASVPRLRNRRCSNNSAGNRTLRASIATTSAKHVAFGSRADALKAHVSAVERRGELIKRAVSLDESKAPKLASEEHDAAPIQNPLEDGFDSKGPAETELPRDEPLYENLSDVPVSQLHDLLRQVQHEQGAFKKVADLVRHLIRDRGESPGLLHYEALVRANADASHGSAAMVGNVLQEMKNQGVTGDKSFFHSCLQALAIHPDYVLRAQVLAEMKARWYELTLEGWHNLIVGLLRDRQFERALDKLEQMQAEGVRVQPWLYDVFIYLFCEDGEVDEALRILQHRVDSGDMDISANVWYYLLDCCSSNFHYSGTLYVWQHRISTSHIHPSDGILTNILSLAARYHDSALATDVVRVLASRTSKLDVHHYECLLAAFAGASELLTAFRILCIMKKARLEPSEGATRPIYRHLVESTAHSPEQAFQILQTLHDDGHPIPVASINVILSAALQVSTLPVAISLYKKLHHLCPEGPNTSTFNILLAGCAKAEEDSHTAASSSRATAAREGDSKHTTGKEAPAKATAMFLASEMVALNVKADPLTYDRLILVCLSEPDPPADSPITGGFEDAMLYLEEMRSMFGRPAKHGTNPPSAAGLSSSNGKPKQWRGAPLRMGTWSAMVRRAADRGNEVVWELLQEMEVMGYGIRKLKLTIEDLWRERKLAEEERRLAVLAERRAYFGDELSRDDGRDAGEHTESAEGRKWDGIAQ